MLSTTDLILLPYTAELSQGGINHACRSFACNHLPMGRLPVERLRRATARTAVELAFRHYLDQQEIPFHVVGTTSFTNPEHYDVSLGGHRCDLTSYTISRQNQVNAIHADPGILLNAQALIPVEQFGSQQHRPNDIQIFAFLLGAMNTTAAGEVRAHPENHPAHWIHALPEEWARPRVWEPLNNLVMKSECPEGLSVQIGGMDSERNFSTAVVELPPRTRTPVETVFHSLAYVHALSKPGAHVDIHSPVRGSPYIISAHAWDDLWIHGSGIWLTGWLTHESFRSKACVLKIGTQTFQFDHTRVRNLAVQVKQLNACQSLFHRVQEWATEHGENVSLH